MDDKLFLEVQFIPKFMREDENYKGYYVFSYKGYKLRTKSKSELCIWLDLMGLKVGKRLTTSANRNSFDTYSTFELLERT